MGHRSRTVQAQLLSVESWYSIGVVTNIAYLTIESCMDPYNEKESSLPI
jgi:uncharacterized membrane protein YjfL (UPF0719 family)